jgi:alkylation response protein AidB-like acyl-CoA dehydrogenase
MAAVSAERPSRSAPPGALSLELARERIAGRAPELDAHPQFPRESFLDLLAAGVPQAAAERNLESLRWEIVQVRGIAAACASSARILDGHFNGVERLALCAEEPLRRQELAGVREGRFLLGVWGADPGPGEGKAARIEHTDGGLVLRGVKTFCSGAGGVQRALVIARDAQGARRLVYVDVTGTVSIDREWYQASGLRSSESHRVEFHDTPVLGVFGGTEEIMRDPWFSRDAVRTAATWAGLCDCIMDATLHAHRGSELDEVRLHAIGEMRVALSTIDRWLEYATSSLGEIDRFDLTVSNEPRVIAGECRVAIADCARLIAAYAVRVCGSRALASGGTLERARRDLDLFLLQHRLDPKILELGADLLKDRAS